MGRNPQYQFVSTDTDTLVSSLVAGYEKITGISVQPASPEKLFLQWVAHIILQERIMNNYTGNQNIPSRAEGDNLDALGELFYATQRPQARPAVCTQRFYLSQAQETAILIPGGTRVTDASAALVWETVEDVYVPIGDTSVIVQIRCQTPGVVGNDYATGQINTLVDLFDYYDHCENITASDSGADRATDEEYYALMRASQDAFSTAGARGAYIYIARQVSNQIGDVVANSPLPARVTLYVLMEDGTIAGEEIKQAVLTACNRDLVRPLTDYVSVEDPEVVEYRISLTYYLQNNAGIGADQIKTAVEEAVRQYVAWQCAKLGRDINPSYLVGLLMGTGIKRVELREPAFTVLRDGMDGTVPQVAVAVETTVTSGGYEDE